MRRRTFLGAAAVTLAACATRRAAAPTAQPEPPMPKSPSKPLSILLLGGTGFLGPQLVSAARARGHGVALFHRGKTGEGLFPELVHLHGDRDGDLSALADKRFDSVIDTSGYNATQVGASAKLLAPNVGHYIFVSTISVYAHPLARGASEDAAIASVSVPPPENPLVDYGANKALAERAALAAMPGRVLAVRPGLIAGPGDPTDRFTYWPARLARGGEILAPGTGEDPWQLVDVRDLAAFLIHAAEQRTMGVMNAVGPAQASTFRELLAAVARGVGAASPQLTWVPEATLEAQEIGPWMDLPVWTGSESGFATIDSRRAIAAGLGFRDVAETARDTLAWWQTQPAERTATPRAGLTAEREAKALAALRGG